MKKYFLLLLVVSLVGCKNLKKEYDLNDTMKVKTGYFLEVFLDKHLNHISPDYTVESDMIQDKGRIYRLHGYPLSTPESGIFVECFYFEEKNELMISISGNFMSAQDIKDVCQREETSVKRFLEILHIKKDVRLKITLDNLSNGDNWLYQNGELKFAGGLADTLRDWAHKNK